MMSMSKIAILMGMTALSVGVMGGNEAAYERRNRRYKEVDRHPLFTSHKVKYTLFSDEDERIIKQGDLFAINQLDVFKDMVVVGIKQEDNLHYLVYSIQNTKPHDLKRKTTAYGFKGTEAELFYKRVVMYLYITSSQSLKRALVEHCFELTHIPAGFSPLLEKANSKELLDTFVERLKLI